MAGVTLFTSLPPKTTRMVGGRDFGAAYQRACIDSWISAGFDVVSLNPGHEIAALQQYDYPVEYVVSQNKRPAIAEFLAEACRSRNEVAGIINADCLLLAHPAHLDSMLSSAKDALVMLERVNIDPRSLLPTGLTCLGFDAFFFSRSIAREITLDPDLSVGQPWWDYWFPAEFLVSGVQLLRSRAPLIFHLDHEQGWSQERWLAYGRKFLAYFAGLDVSKNPRFLTGVREFNAPGIEKREDLGGLGDWCIGWLLANSDFVQSSRDPAIEELFANILNAVTNFDGMHAGTVALADAHRQLARAGIRYETNGVSRQGRFSLRLLRSVFRVR